MATQGKVLITLSARTEHDRTKFVEDLKEAILEVSPPNPYFNLFHHYLLSFKSYLVVMKSSPEFFS